MLCGGIPLAFLVMCKTSLPQGANLWADSCLLDGRGLCYVLKIRSGYFLTFKKSGEYCGEVVHVEAKATQASW